LSAVVKCGTIFSFFKTLTRLVRMILLEFDDAVECLRSASHQSLEVINRKKLTIYSRYFNLLMGTRSI